MKKITDSTRELNMKMNRRKFVQSSAIGLIGAPMVFGAQPRIFKTALVGSGWWGMNILRTALSANRSNAVSLCDVDQKQASQAAAEIERLTGTRPPVYGDYRELIQKEKPEIVIVATPDHWHPLVTIEALNAGAHVFVEKPVGHTIMEGRAMVKAARRNNRMVQVGTHRRFSPHNISGMEFLKSGKAGKIGMVKTFVHYDHAGDQRDPVADREPPETLDWDMWCGPAPLRAFNPRIHPRGFRSFLDYANGTLGDWGIHWLDQVLWWTEEKYPRKVYSTGNRFILDDITDAPDAQIATYEFESFTAVWEHRLFAGHRNENHQFGCYFYGTEGIFHMGWIDGWTFYPRKEGQSIIHADSQLHQPDSQNIPELWDNFLDSIDTGKLPGCDIEIGHRSTNMSLLGMLSMKIGRAVEWDGEKELVIGDEEANQHLKREYRGPWEYPA
jgi:predicted dehydrogenase